MSDLMFLKRWLCHQLEKAAEPSFRRWSLYRLLLFLLLFLFIWGWRPCLLRKCSHNLSSFLTLLLSFLLLSDREILTLGDQFQTPFLKGWVLKSNQRLVIEILRKQILLLTRLGIAGGKILAWKPHRNAMRNQALRHLARLLWKRRLISQHTFQPISRLLSHWQIFKYPWWPSRSISQARHWPWLGKPWQSWCWDVHLDFSIFGHPSFVTSIVSIRPWARRSENYISWNRNRLQGCWRLSSWSVGLPSSSICIHLESSGKLSYFFLALFSLLLKLPLKVFDRVLSQR